MANFIRTNLFSNDDHNTMNTRIIELVSNASFDIYPNNTLSAFSNFLAESIELRGQWEVALAEISYPCLYNNITEGTFTYVYKRIHSGKQLWDNEKLKLPSGMYNTIDEVIEEIDKVSSKARPKDKMTMTAKVMDLNGLLVDWPRVELTQVVPCTH